MVQGNNPPAEANSWGVLLLAHGAPGKLEEIPEVLLNVRGGRPVPGAVGEEIVHRYSLIGGGSPLLRLTRLQAEALAARIARPVYVGMRNWKPYIRDTVLQMGADGVTHAVALCLAPHNSRTSVGLYRRAVIGETGKAPFTVDFVSEWHAEPLLIRAFAEKLRDGWSRACLEANAPVPVLFTAHSVPVSMAAASGPGGGLYQAQLAEAARLVAEGVAAAEGRERPWRLVYQSRSGPPLVPWLGPDVCDYLAGLAGDGAPGVVLVPVGFVSDHLEVVYDLDTEAAQAGQRLGLPLARAATPGMHPRFVSMITELVRERGDRPASRRALGVLGPAPDICPNACCRPGPPARDAGRPGGSA